MRIEDHPILDFEADRGPKVTFSMDGHVMEGFEGEPIIAALHDNGVRRLVTSPRHNHPRGFFCAIGKCSSCLMEVDGIPNVRVCITPLKAGMCVKTQEPLEEGPSPLDGKVLG
jgi:predicted molibdopterin-dependent oxidoreductase YjgC